MAECPVCQSAYVEGRVKRCHNCGWELETTDLARLGPLRVEHQMMAAQLEKIQAWAHHTWTEQQQQPVTLTQLKKQLEQAEVESQSVNTPRNALQFPEARPPASPPRLEPAAPAQPDRSETAFIRRVPRQTQPWIGGWLALRIPKRNTNNYTNRSRSCNWLARNSRCSR